MYVSVRTLGIVRHADCVVVAAVVGDVAGPSSCDSNIGCCEAKESSGCDSPSRSQSSSTSSSSVCVGSSFVPVVVSVAVVVSNNRWAM